MIAPLRRRHRIVFLLLTPVVLGTIFLALSNRPVVPTNDTLPDALKATTADAGEMFFDRPDLFADPPTAARLFRSLTGTVLQLEPLDAVRQPHILVYWRGEDAGDGVASAHLLGQLVDGGARSYLLPAEATGGEIVLYSLAHQEVITQAVLPDFEPPRSEPPRETSEVGAESAAAVQPGEEG